LIAAVCLVKTIGPGESKEATIAAVEEGVPNTESTTSTVEASHAANETKLVVSAMRQLRLALDTSLLTLVLIDWLWAIVLVVDVIIILFTVLFAES